eukprot:g423.t1
MRCFPPSPSLQPPCGRQRLGQLLIIVACGIHATGNVFLKYLAPSGEADADDTSSTLEGSLRDSTSTSDRGVSAFFMLFLRGSVTILLTSIMVGARKGRPGLFRMLTGRSEDIKKVGERPHAPRRRCEAWRPAMAVYGRGAMGAVSAAVLILCFTVFGTTLADAFAIFLGTMTVSANIIAVIFLKEKLQFRWTLSGVYVLLMMLGQLSNASGFKYEGAALGSVLQNSEMVFAFVFDLTLLGEDVQALTGAGAAVIFLGSVSAASGKASGTRAIRSAASIVAPRGESASGGATSSGDRGDGGGDVGSSSSSSSSIGIGSSSRSATAKHHPYLPLSNVEDQEVEKEASEDEEEKQVLISGAEHAGDGGGGDNLEEEEEEQEPQEEETKGDVVVPVVSISVVAVAE